MCVAPGPSPGISGLLLTRLLLLDTLADYTARNSTKLQLQAKGWLGFHARAQNGRWLWAGGVKVYPLPAFTSEANS